MKKQLAFASVLILAFLALPAGEAASTVLREEAGAQTAPGATPTLVRVDNPAGADQNKRSATGGASTGSACDGEGVKTAAPDVEVHRVVVDIYQDMESGNDGEPLTPSTMNASSHGGCGAIPATWDFKYGDKMWVSTDHARSLPGTVTVDGVDYNVSSTRTWMFRNREELECVKVDFSSNQWGAPYHDRMTVACYYTTYQTDPFSNQHDTIEMSGNQSFGVLQTIGDTGDDPPYIRAHSCTEGWETTVSPQIIKVVPGKTYWVNLHYDGPAGEVKVAVFDPDNGWAQVGETAVAESVPGSTVRSIAHFGRCSPHGDWPDNDTSAYFGHILIDYTNAAFPLLPNVSGSVPDLALHGAPADKAIHLDWTVNITLPLTTTWRIDYYTHTAGICTATDPLSGTRSFVLTEHVFNYHWYTVTLHAMLGETSWLSDTVRVMPTDKLVYLPLAIRNN